MIDIVTGGCGFIGSHLVEKLKSQGRQVQIIDLKWGYDIRDPLSFPNNVETIYHLAGLADIVPSIENPIDYFRTNVTGTLNVLEAAKRCKAKKFIYTASASCYGNTPHNPTSECHPVNPQYPYALTKDIGEQLVMHWSKIYKIPSISLRLFNVYGLRQRTTDAYGAMFGTFLAQKANNEPMTIIGDGEQQRDFVHVSDVVNALILAANSDKEGIYNVGTGKPISVNKITELLAGKTINIPKRPGEPNITCADITKIKNDLKWYPEVSIGYGITELIEHLDDYKNSPLWTPEKIEKATKTWFERLS